MAVVSSRRILSSTNRRSFPVKVSSGRKAWIRWIRYCMALQGFNVRYSSSNYCLSQVRILLDAGTISILRSRLAI
jgi:hypothetical protein